MLSLLIAAFMTLGSWLGPGFIGPARSYTGIASQVQPYTVRFHPDGPLQVGDLVSLEIISPPGVNLGRDSVQVSVQSPEVQNIGRAQFGGFGAGGFRAVLQWAWDTSGLQPGTYTLLFSIQERAQAWQQTVRLNPPSLDRSREHWAQAETQCCVVHYITGTAAERDLAKLLPMIDAQAKDVAQKMGVTLTDKIEINLIPRVLGQGGFTTDQIYISYLDHNYANSNTAQLIHHEMVHRFDATVKSDLRPTFLVEGLAVYLSGGHYQKEPVMLRAASLLRLGQYLPLPYLIDHFYPSQHETGYIEAGAFIEYLVRLWGWDRYNAFYRDIHAQAGGSQAKAIDAALRVHYGLTLDQLESQFTGYLLDNLPAVPDVEQEVQETLDLYDTIRQYQKQLDPSAYFEQAWLPDAKQMRDKGIVADYLRGPGQPENRQVENMLYAAGASLNQGDFEAVHTGLARIQAFLAKVSGSRFPSLIAALE